MAKEVAVAGTVVVIGACLLVGTVPRGVTAEKKSEKFRKLKLGSYSEEI